jgi:hypothetical protein
MASISTAMSIATSTTIHDGDPSAVAATTTAAEQRGQQDPQHEASS